MKKIIVLVVLFASFFLGAIVKAGVEPSPFKEVIQGKIDQIIEKLMPLTENDPLGAAPGDVQELATEVVDYLQAVEELPVKRHLVAMQSVGIMERITAVMFNPQPEPPAQLTALGILLRLAKVGFNPQPEPPGHVTRSLTVLDRISAVPINPQPEPPGVDRVINTLNALDGISRIAFDPQPEPPGKAPEVMAVFDAVAAIAFDPQPEPPGIPVSEMFDILNLLGAIAEPEVSVAY
ncbi:MAG: hypothetical protein V1706_01290 [Pseudomonadota bacterium]